MTREELRSEIDEKRLDLAAFLSARDIVRARLLEVLDSKSVLTPLPNWSGTDAVLGSLDLAIHAMERTIEELSLLMQTLPEESPRLRLVKDEEGRADS